MALEKAKEQCITKMEKSIKALGSGIYDKEKEKWNTLMVTLMKVIGWLIREVNKHIISRRGGEVSVLFHLRCV